MTAETGECTSTYEVRVQMFTLMLPWQDVVCNLAFIRSGICILSDSQVMPNLKQSITNIKGGKPMLLPTMYDGLMYVFPFLCNNHILFSLIQNSWILSELESALRSYRMIHGYESLLASIVCSNIAVRCIIFFEESIFIQCIITNRTNWRRRHFSTMWGRPKQCKLK